MEYKIDSGVKYNKLSSLSVRFKVSSHCKGIATASQPVENWYGTGDVSYYKCRLGVLFTLPNTERHVLLTERRVACIFNGSSVRVHTY